MSDPFSIAAGVIAVAQLSQSLGLFVYGLTERPDQCRRLASELACIEGLMSQLRKLEDALGSQREWQAKVSVLQQLVENLDSALQQLDARVKKVSVPKPEALAVWPMHERAIKGLLDTIERCKTNILIQLHFNQADLFQILNDKACEIQHQLELVNSNVSELLHQSRSLASDERAHHREESLRLARKEREATLAWLTKVSFVADHNALQQKWIPGTTNWFFEETAFREWNTSSASDVLLVIGNAGCGKTIIASRLVEYLKGLPESGPSTLLGHVYCSSKQPAKTDPSVLASSLLQQLCHASPVLDESVVQLREQYRRLPNASPSLAEITKVLASVVKSQLARCYLIIDGLDECDDGSKLAEILDLLRKTPTSTVKIAIFSRRSCPVWPGYFGDVPQISVDPEANGKDIELFAHKKLAQLARHTQVLKNQSLRSDIVRTMLAGADGMFLWVDLQAEILRSKPTEKSLRKALNQLPRAIEQVFEDAMQRIRSQEDDTCQLAVRTLNWALSARQPLQIREMLEAIAVDDSLSQIGPGDLVHDTELMAYCKDLVVLDPRGYVHLLHSSLRAVLHSKIRGAAAREHATLPLTKRPNFHLAKVCVTYLLFTDFAGAHSSCHEAIDVVIEEHPFLQYAAQNWAWHASKAEADTSSLNDKMLRLLCDRHRMNLIVDVTMYTAENVVQGHLGSFHDRNPLHFIAENSLVDLYAKSQQNELQRLSFSANLCGYTPLDLSLVCQQHEICLKLLEQEDWLSKTNYATHRLHLAIQHGWLDVVKKMLSLRARLDLFNDRGHAPLYVACAHGRGIKMLELLLNAGADVNQPCLEGNKTSLMIAAELGKTEIVEYLLQQKADVMAQTEYGQTALHAGASHGHVGVIQLLLQADQAKSSIHVGDKYQETPIFDAVQHGHEEVVKLLITHGAKRHDDLYQKDSSGWSPLDIFDIMYQRPSLPESARFLSVEITAMLNEVIELHAVRLLAHVDPLFPPNELRRSILQSTISAGDKPSSTLTLHTSAAVGSSEDVQQALGESIESIWQVDPWGRIPWDLAIGEYREAHRCFIYSAAIVRPFDHSRNLPNTRPDLVNLSNRSYLQATGVNFCLFLICEVCNKHMNECHWLHCKLCSKLGEGWDICEHCFREKRDRDDGESICPSGHDGEDLQLLFIANHTISGPMVALEDL